MTVENVQSNPTVDSDQSAEDDPFALNVSWCFGFNKSVPIINTSTGDKKTVLYAAGHTGVIYDFVENTQKLLQGHTSNISCTAASGNKRWVVLGDNGPDNMISIWDTTTNTPIRNIFDVGGVQSLAISNDARYVAIINSQNEFIVWDWTSENEEPLHRRLLDTTPQLFLAFSSEAATQLVSNSSSQVVLYHFDEENLTVHVPDLPEKDFNRPIGNFSQTVFKPGTSQVLAASKDGSVTVFDNKNGENPAFKKVLKIVKLIDDPITSVTSYDDFVVMGSEDGAVRFYDSTLRVTNWYGTFNAGTIISVSFSAKEKVQTLSLEEEKSLPAESTLEATPFVIADFSVSTEESIVCHVPGGTNKIMKILHEHNDIIQAIDTHPLSSHVAVGSYCGLLKVWDYANKKEVTKQFFGLGNEITALSYDNVGEFLAVGFYSGLILVLDSVTLEVIKEGHFAHARAPITQIAFSHDSIYLAAVDSDNTTTLMKKTNSDSEPWVYVGRNKAHYKPIVNILFGIALDSNVPRLLTLGQDRNLVEYDLMNSTEDNLIVLNTDKIEQSAIPTACVWYPPINKEHFLLLANNEYKLKLLNATTKMCRKTLLGPTHGSCIKKMVNVSGKDNQHYLAFITDDKIGLTILPLDGNPHNTTALLGHCDGASNLVVSADSRYIFSVGGKVVRMWEVSPDVLHATAALGGSGLTPFYELLEGGKDGVLAKEMEEYFYYSQMRSQSVATTDQRKVGTTVPLAEVPNIMRALGFYPTELQVQDMLNEIKFSQYVDTGTTVTEVDLPMLIKLYCNHRPVFGLPLFKVYDAFEMIAGAGENGEIDRGLLLSLLQQKGEHISEPELAEYLASLLDLYGSATNQEDKMASVAPNEAAATLETILPETINADMFTGQVLGFQSVCD